MIFFLDGSGNENLDRIIRKKEPIMAAQTHSQSVHPEILKHNIKVGDFIMIAPDKQQDKIFLVDMIRGNEVYIHPGSRPSQMKVLTLGQKQNAWILTSNTPDEKFIDWSYQPGRYGNNTQMVDEIKIMWEERDHRAIQFMPQEDTEMTDYRQIKESIINYAKELESDITKPIVKHKIRGDEYENRHIPGYEEGIQIKARTSLGAKVTYMNWLDTQNITDFDNYMWDQMNPYMWCVHNFSNPSTGEFSIQDLVKEFDEDFDPFVEILVDPPIISFPGPQIDMIKAIGKN